jgi:hypothetical protein
MIKFPCPHCGVNISAEPEHYGTSANCPSCGNQLAVPSDHTLAPSEQFESIESKSVATGTTCQGHFDKFGQLKVSHINWIPALVFMCIGSLIAWATSFQYTPFVSVKPRIEELLLALLLFVSRPIFWAILHHKCWAALPEQHRATTPARAVGFLFIPFFNFYWAFVSWPKLSQGLSTWREERGMPLRSTRGLGIAYSILFVCACTLGLIPGVGILIGIAQLVIFILYYHRVASSINEVLKEIIKEDSSRSPKNPEFKAAAIWGGKGRDQLKRPGARRMIKIVVPAVLCVLVALGIAVVVHSKSGGSDARVTESAPVQAKQKTNQAGYDAYMTGYNDPEQGDVAEAMFDRFSGGERQAALLMILGAEDRRKNLPIRFVVVSE